MEPLAFLVVDSDGVSGQDGSMSSLIPRRCHICFLLFCTVLELTAGTGVYRVEGEVLVSDFSDVPLE